MTSQRDKRVSIRAFLDSGLSMNKVDRKTGTSRVTVTTVRDPGVERKMLKRQNSARMLDLVAQVAQQIEENPKTTVWALVRETGSSLGIMSKLESEYLEMRSYTFDKRQKLEVRRKRHELCRALINNLKGPDAGAILLFHDKKITLEKYHNRHNAKVVLRQGDL